MSLIRVLLGAVFLLSPAILGAQLSADSAALLDGVFASFDRDDSPGCAVGVDRNGRPIFRRGYGMASLEHGVRMSEHSVIESGSVAKQFTAGAIVYLALQGKLDLDDPIRKHVPELRDFGSPVTIRAALTHTSGLRDMWMLFWLTGEDQGRRLYTMDQALGMIYRQRELNFPPGSAYLYSNSGFLLLAEVVRRVSGKSLARFSPEVFFEPLGMRRTQWRDDLNRVVPGRATAYAPAAGGEFRVQMPFMDVYGTGGLLTTVGDLLRWNEHLTHPTIGGEPWADLMHQRGRLTTGREIAYASGVIVSEYRGEPEVSHSGSSGGYETFLGRWPRRGLSVAVMCNLAGTSATRLARRVADVFIGPSTADVVPDVSVLDSVRGPAPIRRTELAKLAGTYHSEELDVSYRITLTGDRLTMQFGERAPIDLFQMDGTGSEFVAAPMSLRLRFTRGAGGAATGFLLSARRVQNIRFVRR